MELYIPLVIQGFKESFFSLRESCFNGACLFNTSKNEDIKLSKLLFRCRQRGMSKSKK